MNHIITFFILLITITQSLRSQSSPKGMDTQIPDKWLTPYEKTNYLATPRFDETMKYCRQLEKSSSWIKVTSFGITPQGRELPLVVVSKEKSFTPERAKNSNKPIVLIQNGIHAGEIDGKDACLMLMRDMVITKHLSHLLDHCNILIMPIFNLDGHERFGPYNRINQNGPKEMGWRVTAQNLNLNRDYMKADAPEMRAWLSVFNSWLPDMVIDCHVTDGIDFRYDITYAMEMFENAPRSIVEWQKGVEKYFIDAVQKNGHMIAPYVFPREEKDLSKGLNIGAATPRFSTGYVAIRNRSALLIETHMLKNYRTRVEATYHLIKAALEYINQDPDALKKSVKESDEETVGEFWESSEGVDHIPLGKDASLAKSFPLRFEMSDKSSTTQFLGYKSESIKSEISGFEYTHWTHDSINVTIPVFNKSTPSVTVIPPRLYLIPQEWQEIIAVLNAHGIKIDRLAKDIELEVESYKFKNAKWREQPYEGRHPVTFSKDAVKGKRFFSKGTYVVKLNQPAAKVAIHLLEPDGPDSFVGWGFFDAIFERKEYYETYVMEEVAKDMLQRDENLKKEFEAMLAADTTFAKNPRARLDFFYDHSPYADKQWNVYPVARYVGRGILPTRKTE